MKGTENIEPIAIIGMSCRLPGKTNSPEEYWNMLINGVNAISEIPEERWSISDYYHPEKEVLGKSHSKYGGFIENMEMFDYDFFGISNREAEYLDPQQRHLLELTWEALEDAGICPSQISYSNTGVFIGGFALDYMFLQYKRYENIGPYTTVGTMMNMLANRISYIFNLRGPSITLDTACSSSLVAVHCACRSIQNGECDIALAGGMELAITPDLFISDSKGGFLSKGDKLKAFDKDADGYIRGEGGGVIVLQKLSEAIKSKNNIYAVIRNSGVNQDGKTTGITVPNKEAQKELLNIVYKKVGILPSSVQYVEAHGTGTAVGDPIEAVALGEFFGEGRDSDEPLIIASAKANIGHLEAAAGLASIVKTVMCINKKQIPPHINVESINFQIDTNTLKLLIPNSMMDWPTSADMPSVAGVNAFGFGGTNAHIILQEYREEKLEAKGIEESIPMILTISAKNEASMIKLVEKYIEYLYCNDNRLIDICYSSSCRRDHHNFRLAVVGKTKSEMAKRLEDYLESEITQNLYTGKCKYDTNPRVAFVFSGMGSQWWKMGRQLIETDSTFCNTIKRIDLEFSKYVNWSLYDELLSEEQESHIQDNNVAQPALFAIQVALFEKYRDLGVFPDVIIGHSAGEMAAFYTAGVYSLADAVKIVFIRSVLQSRLAGKGRMLAVSISEKEAKIIIEKYKGKVCIAAVNSASNITLSGDEDSLSKIEQYCNSKNIYNKFLRGNIPFHSLYMDEIKEELYANLHEISPKKSNVKLFTTGRGNKAEGFELNAEYWWENIRGTVKFYKAMKEILEEDFCEILEISPHPVLATAVLDIANELHKKINYYESLKRYENDEQVLYGTCAKLYCNGYKVDFNILYKDVAQFVNIPKYQWNHTKVWRESEKSVKKRLGIKEHEFLGQRLEIGMPCWKLELSLEKFSFLKDHCIGNNVVVPGAFYLEMAFNALRIYHKTNYMNFTMVNISFKKALFFSDQGLTYINLIYDTNISKILIYGAPDIYSSPLELIFEASVRWTKGVATATINIDDIESSDGITICKEKIYQGILKNGYNYGTAFKGIKWSRISGDTVVSKIETLDSLHVKEVDNILHPVLLDSAIQTSLLPLINDKGIDVRLPTEIKELCIYKHEKEELYVYTHYVEHKKDKTIVDLDIVNMQGELIMKVRGLSLKSIESNSENFVNVNKICYSIGWEKKENELVVNNTNKRYLIFDDSNKTGTYISSLLLEQGYTCKVLSAKNIYFEIEEKGESQVQEIISRILANLQTKFTDIVYCLSLDAEDDINHFFDNYNKSKQLLCYLPIGLLNTVARENVNVKVWIVTKGTVKIDVNETICGNTLLQNTVWGIGRVSGQAEYSKFWGGNIDLSVNMTKKDWILLLADITSNTSEDQVAYRNGERYVARIRTAQEELVDSYPISLRKNGVYIVTGAFGALGKITVEWLVDKGAKYLMLIGRTKFPEREKWHQIKQENKLYKNINFIKELEGKGVSVLIASLDLTNEKEVSEYILKYKSQANYRPIYGVVHAAGIVKDTLMAQMGKKEFDLVFDVKVKGAITLHNELQNDPLDFFIMFSSISAWLTSDGQANYASANSVLNALSIYRRELGMPALSIGWGPWDIGMASDRKLVEFFKEYKGMNLISVPLGKKILDFMFGQRLENSIVCPIQWDKVLQGYPSNLKLFERIISDSNTEECDIIKREKTENCLVKIGTEWNDERGIAFVESRLISCVSSILKADLLNIDKNVALVMMGVDSIVAMELKNSILNTFNVNINIIDILGGINIIGLTKKIYNGLVINNRDIISGNI